MDLEEFLEITGLSLTAAQEDQYETMNNKALARLEHALGWSFSSSDNYEEVGQYLNPSWLIDQIKIYELAQNNKLSDMLQDPDDITNTWRLFPYYDLNTNMRIDPCSAVYKAKLVYPIIGEDNQFITICNLSKFVPLVGKSIDQTNWITYLTKLADFPGTCSCKYSETSSPMLAIDAEWLAKSIPTDLKEVLANMIIYEYQNKPSLQADAGRPLKSKSESVDGHSVSKTYADSETLVSNDPLKQEGPLSVIKSYMGPWSPLYKERRIY